MAAHTSENRRKVRTTLDRRDASRDWLNENFFPEFEEVYRFYKARTEPILDSKGNEDKSRTNVCMPDYWIIGRRKSSRLASRPPAIRVRAKSEEVSQFLSGWTALQWDRAQEQRHQKRHTLQATLMGLSVKEHWWDKVVKRQSFRRSSKVLLEKFGVIVEETDQGEDFRIASPQELEEGASRSFSGFSSEQQGGIMAGLPPEGTEQSELMKYEGPVSSLVFLGDFYPEPEFESVHSSAWIITENVKNIEWLTHFSQQKFIDPDTGKERDVFDPEAVRDLLKMKSFRHMSEAQEGEDSLKERLRDAVFKNRPEFASKLIPGKRFHVLAEHTFRDGWPWIRWVANEKILLGEMPYAFDLQGHYAFSGLTPIPDLLIGIGDSSPRILRHLMKLHNVAVDQRTDFLNQVLKRLILMREGADVPEEIIDRGLFRILKVKDLNSYKFEDMPNVPREAWEHEAQIIRMMQLGEPAMTDFGTQTQAVPESQKVATLGLLQQRAAETLSADELEQLNESIALETRIKLWMLQQTLQGQQEVPPEFMKEFTSQHGGAGQGQPRTFRMDALELQEDFEVFPEMGSTLALDDVDRRRDALQIYMLALQNPEVWNIREAAKRLASTFRGRGGEELLAEPRPPQPPQPRLGINISIAYKDLEADVKAQVMQGMGLQPSAQAEAKGVVDQLELADRGARALESLESSRDEDEAREAESEGGGDNDDGTESP